MSALSWTAVLELLRRIPRGAWYAAGLALAAVTIFTVVTASIAWVRADERAKVLAEGASTNSVLLRWQREAAQQRLDSVQQVAARLRDSVSRHFRVVSRWTPLIPPSVRRTLPPVDSLVQACTRLARDCDSLATATARVDTLWRTITTIDSTQLRAHALTIVRLQGRVAALEAKSCLVPTGVGTATGAALGFLVGRRR